MYNIKTLYRNNQDAFTISVVILLYYIHHSISFNRGINYEEFRDANACLLSLDGYLPYRDFEWLYGPFSLLIYSFLMKIFGPMLIVLRISYIFFASLAIPLTYFLAKRIMPSFFAGMASFLAVVFFNVPYYTFNHVFAVLGELMSILLLCKFIERKTKNTIIWVGISCAIVLLTKPFLSGFSLFAGICLTLLVIEKANLKKRLRNIFNFVLASFLPVVMYLLYLFFQTKLKNISLAYPPFLTKDSITFIDQVPRINLMAIVSVVLKRLSEIMPMDKIAAISSMGELKQFFVSSLDAFVYSLFLITPFLLLLIFLGCKYNKVTPEVREKVFGDKNFLLLFTIISICISSESLMITHNLSKAYNTQVVFILAVYLLYFIRMICPRRKIATTIFLFLFLFYISFLNFFRYPYTMSKIYTFPLNLDRGKGIFVSSAEKELYESLSLYFSANLNMQDTVLVFGYYPQVSFLTKQRNVFFREEYIFVKLSGLMVKADKIEELKSLLFSMENRILSAIYAEKPKVVLIMNDSHFREGEFLTSRINECIAKNYSFVKKFGPVNIYGPGNNPCWVNLFTLRY